MKTQYSHTIPGSIYLWADKLLNENEGYYAKDTYIFEKYSGGNGYTEYYAPYKNFKFNNDQGYSYSGIYIDDQFVNFGESGIIIDNEKGRALIPDPLVSSNESVSGEFSSREFGIYFSNESENDLLINKNFYLIDQDQTYFDYLNKQDKYDYTYPSIFIGYDGNQNFGFALGGMKDTKSYIRLVVLSENQYQLDGVLSVFDDELHSCIKKIDFDDFPLGFSDSLKTGEYPFNYGTYFSERENNENLFIESINTAKLKDNTIISKQSVPKFYVGFVDITLSNPRNII